MPACLLPNGYQLGPLHCRLALKNIINKHHICAEANIYSTSKSERMLMRKLLYYLQSLMNIHTTCFHSLKNTILVNVYTFGLSLYIIKCQKGIFECVCFIFCILQRVYRTRKFLVCPETFGLKLLVSFLFCFYKENHKINVTNLGFIKVS